MAKIRYTGAVPVEDAWAFGALILPKQVIERPDAVAYNYCQRDDFEPVDKAAKEACTAGVEAVRQALAVENGTPVEPVDPAEDGA